MKSKHYAVIMAGGGGTRLWPISRSRRPKQLLKLFSTQSLVRETVDRVLPIFDPQNILVVTVPDHYKEIRRELNFLPARNFLVEPKANNTAPCVGLAAIELRRRDSNAMMVVLPADHWISRGGPFRRTIKASLQLVRMTNALVTIGVRPVYPETGYGYIFKNRRIKAPHGIPAYQIRAFKEKPSLGTAARWISRGAVWNSGIFVWRASTILAMLNRFAPAISRGLRSINDAIGPGGLASSSSKFQSVCRRAYGKMPSVSIDHAVLEKAAAIGRVLTVDAPFAWSDLGSWPSLHQLLPHDREGNAAIGKWVGVNTRDCMVHASNRLVVLLGMRQALVVDSPDALLVANMGQAQDIRHVVKKLQERGYGKYVVR